MTSDPEIEARLRQYQPRGPTPALRERIAVSAKTRRPSPLWYVAMAALLLLSLFTYRATDAMGPPDLDADQDAVAVARLAAWLGGQPQDLRRARTSVATYRADADARHARGGSMRLANVAGGDQR